MGEAFKTAVTTQMRFVQTRPDPLQLPRIDTYYLRKGWSQRPLFRRDTRLYLELRAWLRFARGMMRRP